MITSAPLFHAHGGHGVDTEGHVAPEDDPIWAQNPAAPNGAGGEQTEQSRQVGGTEAWQALDRLRLNGDHCR